MPVEIDPSRCPLCDNSNQCGAVDVASNAGDGQGASVNCWCMDTEISPQALNEVPEDLRGIACICRTCATRSR